MEFLRSFWAVPLFALPLIAAFPPLEWRFLGWVGLIPLFYFLKNSPFGAKDWAKGGFLMGLVYNGFLYAWLYRTLVEIGGVSLDDFILFSTAGLVGLAFIPAFGLALVRLGAQNLGLSPYLTLPALMALADWALGEVPFGGIPWGTLATTTTQTPAARLLIPVFGGAGMVMVMGLLAAGWAWCMEALVFGRMNPWGWILFFGATSGWLFFPWSGFPPPNNAPPGLSVVVVPGNILPNEDEATRKNRLRTYLVKALTPLKPTPQTPFPRGETPQQREGKSLPLPKLTAFPESAKWGHMDDKTLLEIAQLGELAQSDFMLGADFKNKSGEYNSIFLIKQGEFSHTRYDKRERVPFGEYVPSGFRWAFGDKLTAGETDYQAGESLPVLDWKGIKLGVAICFESILPRHFLQMARSGAKVGLVLANDTWLTPSGRTQHLNLTALRGLETGMDIVFVSNGGPGGLLRPEGDHIIQPAGADPFEVKPRLTTETTPFTDWGHTPVVWASFALIGLAFFLANRRGRSDWK